MPPPILLEHTRSSWRTCSDVFLSEPCVCSVSVPMNLLMSSRCAMISCIAPCLLVFWVDAKHCGFHQNECLGHLGMFINIFGICSGIQSSYLGKSGLWGSCLKDSLRSLRLCISQFRARPQCVLLVLRTEWRGSWPQPCEAIRPFPSSAFSWSFPWSWGVSFACAERGQPPHPTPPSAARVFSVWCAVNFCCLGILGLLIPLLPQSGESLGLLLGFPSHSLGTLCSQQAIMALILFVPFLPGITVLVTEAQCLAG